MGLTETSSARRSVFLQGVVVLVLWGLIVTLYLTDWGANHEDNIDTSGGEFYWWTLQRAETKDEDRAKRSENAVPTPDLAVDGGTAGNHGAQGASSHSTTSVSSHLTKGQLAERLAAEGARGPVVWHTHEQLNSVGKSTTVTTTTTTTTTFDLADAGNAHNNDGAGGEKGSALAGTPGPKKKRGNNKLLQCVPFLYPAFRTQASPRPIVFVKTPKCGGTTVNGILGTHAHLRGLRFPDFEHGHVNLGGKDDLNLILSRAGVPMDAVSGELLEPLRNSIDVIASHMNYGQTYAESEQFRDFTEHHTECRLSATRTIDFGALGNTLGEFLRVVPISVPTHSR